MPVDSASEGTVLELRGILGRGPQGVVEEFELLRVHERPPRDWGRARLDEQTPLRARLTDEARHELAAGWAGAASTTFDDGQGTGPFDTAAQLVRILLPLPPDGGRGHGDAPWVVELSRGDLLLWREQVAPARPRLDVEAASTDDALHVHWRIEADGPVDLLLQPHDGVGRLRVAQGEVGGSAVLPAQDLPGGPLVVVARAVSRLREATARSEVVELPSRAAVLQIHLERLQAPAGQPVTATAVLTDAWGRSVPPEHARWFVGGEPVGTGAGVVLDLGAGTHTVRVEHEDAAPSEADLLVT